MPLVALVLGLILGAAAPAAAQSGSDDDEDALLVSEARRAFADKEYQRAATLLDRALQVNPRRIDAYVLRARVHGISKEHPQAVALMQRARSLAPSNPDVLTTLGNQLMRDNRPGEAVPILENVVASWPNRYEAHITLGYHYSRQEQWPKAITALEAYLRLRPKGLRSDDATHRLELANAYLRSGTPRTARDLYDRVLKERPKSVLGWLGMAWATAAIDCNKAIPMLRRLAKLSKTYPEVLIVQGRCALLLGDIGEALSTAEDYQKRRPKSAQAWALLGEARAAKKDVKGAQTALERAVKLDPGNRLYVLKLARVERLSGQPERAIARLRGGNPPRGSEQEWTVELGEALSAGGKHSEVRQLFGSFVAKHPKNAQAQALLGIAIYELDEPEAAIQHLEEALKLDSREDRVRGPLAAALNLAAVSAFKSGDTGKAEIYLVRADAVRPDPMIMRNLGAVRIAMGKPDTAIAPLEKAVETLRDDDVTLHLLGRAYHDSRDYKNARRVFKQALLQVHSGTDRHIDVAIDAAASEIADGADDGAMDILEEAFKTAKGDAVIRLGEAYIIAARTSATKAMLDGNFALAYRLLGKVEATVKQAGKKSMNNLQCDLALAATGAGLRAPALRLLRTMESQRVRCPFAAPDDELAVQILIAWNEGATARTAKRALKRLDGLRRKATGPAASLVRTAARDIAVRAAIDAYESGSVDKARPFLETARKYDPDSPELEHNLAVLDLGAGKVDRAIPKLVRASREVPEALVNLGIAYDLKGRPLEALEYYRRGRTAGARGGNVKTWIDNKERLWGVKGGN